MSDLPEIRTLIQSLDVRGKPRVVAACLKNAAGSTERLRKQLIVAAVDYRDVLAEAEYPLAAAKRWSHYLPWQLQEIYDKDWEQYQKWFTRS